MIVDNIKNCEQYYSVNKKYEKAFEFIKKAVLENFDAGKYEIDGDDIFGMVQSYSTKPVIEGKFEGHRAYIDIQYIISGTEVIKVVDISKVSPKTEYDAEKDFQLFENTDRAGKVVLESGDYAIFMPYDIHKPGLSFNENVSDIKKIVVKVKI